MVEEPNDIGAQLYGLRMLILMENEEGKFNQVLLSPKQFKVVSDIVSAICQDEDHDHSNMRPGFEMRETLLGDKELDGDIFIGMCDIHEEHEE